MSQPDQTYLAKLLLYYEEEIEGEAYFQGLARRFPDPAQHKRLTLLAQVERRGGCCPAYRAICPVAPVGREPDRKRSRTGAPCAGDMGGASG